MSKQGEIYGIIGPNGSGKTTLMNCITGFIKPDAGPGLFQGKRNHRMAGPQNCPHRHHQDLSDHEALLFACLPSRT